MSKEFLKQFVKAFLKYYGVFEHDFEAKADIVQLGSARDKDKQFSVELTFRQKSRREGEAGEARNAAEGPDVIDKTNFSKGKKVVYTLCFMLALNAVQPVR